MPRVVLVDTDLTALNTVSGGSIALRPENLVVGGGTEGNWARGYYAAGGVPGRVLAAIRSEAEKCDRLQGFQIVHSLGGGTGSGLGTRVLDAVRLTFPGRTVNTFSVVPATATSRPTVAGSALAAVETYNVGLSVTRLIDAAHNTYIADNRTLYDTCAGPAMNIDAPSYDDLNHLAAQTMSGVTTGLRFAGDLNADMRKCTANLVPYPKMHFFVPVFAPHTYRGQTDPCAYTITELGQRLFATVASRCVAERRRSIDVSPVVVMAAAMTFRGRGLRTADRNDRRIVVVDAPWLPDNVKTACYDVPSRGLQISGTVVANTTAVADVFDAMGGRYAATLAKKSFLHLYTDEGMTMDDFKHALEEIETLMADYRSIENDV